jgi:transposase
MTTIFKKLFPYILIITLGMVLYCGFRYYTEKVESLTISNNNLQHQLSQVNTNYSTLQNMYSISIKQYEELQKSQKESLEYVSELKQKLTELNFREEYSKDKESLLKSINDYEKCYSKNVIKNPSYKCYGEKNVK